MTNVIKVTSKGQITLPVKIRRSLDLGKDSYIVVDTIGDYIIMKKVGLTLKEISDIMAQRAKQKGITRKEIEAAVEEAKQRIWEE